MTKSRGVHGSYTLEKRFWAYVNKTDACWLWLGRPSTAGYGRIQFKGKYGGVLLAHRAILILQNCPDPGPFDVMHLCDNPPCVNPAHLRVGTHKENMEDRERKGRGNQPKGLRNGKAKLSDAQVAEIRWLGRQGFIHKEIAAEFGIGLSTVNHIILRLRRPHVP